MKEVKREYYKNGQVWFETPYKNGLINGVQRKYNSKGQLWSEIPYVDGKLHGIEKHWYDNGKLRFVYVYENDVWIKDHGLVVWDCEEVV